VGILQRGSTASCLGLYIEPPNGRPSAIRLCSGFVEADRRRSLGA